MCTVSIFHNNQKIGQQKRFCEFYYHQEDRNTKTYHLLKQIMLLEPEKRRSKKAKKSAITRSSHTESQQLPITTYSILIKMEGDRFFFFLKSEMEGERNWTLQ